MSYTYGTEEWEKAYVELAEKRMAEQPKPYWMGMPEWLAAYEKLVQEDAEYKEAAKDWEGTKFSWRDIDSVLDFLPRLAAQQGGLARLLGKGTIRAAREIGRGTDQFLTDSKGLEAPYHDPRCNWGDGVAYAMSVRGPVMSQI